MDEDACRIRREKLLEILATRNNILKLLNVDETFQADIKRKQEREGEITNTSHKPLGVMTS